MQWHMRSIGNLHGSKMCNGSLMQLTFLVTLDAHMRLTSSGSLACCGSTRKFVSRGWGCFVWLLKSSQCMLVWQRVYTIWLLCRIRDWRWCRSNVLSWASWHSFHVFDTLRTASTQFEICCGSSAVQTVKPRLDTRCRACRFAACAHVQVCFVFPYLNMTWKHAQQLHSISSDCCINLLRYSYLERNSAC